MHASDDDVGIILFCVVPESFFGALSIHDFSAEELCAARLVVGIDLGLVLLLDEGWLVLEWQVFLLFVSDRDDVKAVLLGAEKTLHGDSEGQFRGLTAVDSDHVIVASFLGRENAALDVRLYHNSDLISS